MSRASGASRDDAPARREKAPPGPIPTLGELARYVSWVWVHCEARGCHHQAPLKLAEPIASYGQDMTSDVLRVRTRCRKCGHLGASIRLPSWVDSVTGVAPFPDSKSG